MYKNLCPHGSSQEGNQLYEDIVQLKMQSADGKYYKTDVADTEQLFRLIQSIPSPKAEPFKLWLAQIASERLDEIQDRFCKRKTKNKMRLITINF